MEKTLLNYLAEGLQTDLSKLKGIFGNPEGANRKKGAGDIRCHKI